jgi:YegS/Rv2252/BmrU family lipid kinase
VRAVFNPGAGVRARRSHEAVRRGRPSWDLELVPTAGPGDATRLAREAAERGCEMVLAVGGDGTANEVGAGLLDTGVALGLVPAGSGNGLARVLGIPLDPERALPALERGQRRAIDVGVMNGKPFLNVAGVGFDAAVAAAFAEHTGRGGRRGIPSYVHLSLGLARRYRAFSLRGSLDGGQIDGRFLLAAFCNGEQYGAAARIAPGARLDDGLLDAVLLEDATLLELLAAVPRVFSGRLEGFRRYRRRAVREAAFEAVEPCPWHRDGEPEPPASRFEVTVRPGALVVVAPEGKASRR